MGKKKSNVVSKMKEIEDKRNARRAKMEEKRAEKRVVQSQNEAMGNGAIDADFQLLNHEAKISSSRAKPHLPSLGMSIYVCVRKRPIFEKEQKAGQIDCVSTANPTIRVQEPKYKVDGITKYIDKHDH